MRRLKHLAELHAALPMPAPSQVASGSTRNAAEAGLAEAQLGKLQLSPKRRRTNVPSVQIQPEPSHAQAVSQPSRPARADDGQQGPAPYKGIVVCSSRSAKNSKSGVQGYSKSFHKEYRENDYKVGLHLISIAFAKLPWPIDAACTAAAMTRGTVRLAELPCCDTMFELTWWTLRHSRHSGVLLQR